MFRVPFTMAYQPIVSLGDGAIFGHEALVRGVDGGSAYSVLSQLTADTIYNFDQLCRVKAISMAQALGVSQTLSINFLPNAIYEPRRCLAATLAAARKTGFPLHLLMFELSETEKISDIGHVRNIIAIYREAGFRTALDDFGAGHAGLTLLADIQPDFIKLDMALIRDIDTDVRRRRIVAATVRLCDDLGIIPIAEGIETRAELEAVRDCGVDLVQGYFTGRPEFEGLVSQARIEAILGMETSPQGGRH